MDLKDFNAIEKKYNLPELNLNGYYYWNYVRTLIEWKIEQQKFRISASSTEEKLEFSQRMKKKIEKTKNIFLHGRIKKKKCNILVLNHERRVWNDDAYECIYTDEIVKKYDKVVVLEAPYNGEHYKPAKTKDMVYTDIVEFYSYVYCSACHLLQSKKFNGYKQKMSDSLRKPLFELNERYGTSIEIEEIENSLIYGYYMYQVEKVYYSRIIRKLRPKLILEVVSYSRKCMVVNEIAGKKGIPTIELQHGTIGEEHVDYNYPLGYTIHQFPEYLFLFGDYWKEKSSFPISRDRIFSVGYPYMDNMEQKYGSVRKDKTKKNILFLSTGPIGIELANLAVGLTNLLDLKKYHIIYKLHPVEYKTWKERYPMLMNADVEVIDNNKQNLYELFCKSDIQIGGFNSTTIFEGLYFGLKTFLLSYGMTKEFRELCDSGIAFEIMGIEDLYKKILEEENNSNGSSPNLSLWKKDGLNNMIKEINKLLATNKE